MYKVFTKYVQTGDFCGAYGFTVAMTYGIK